MRHSVVFLVAGEPQGKARARVVSKGGKIHAYTPKKTVSYEEQIQSAAQIATNEPPLEGAVALHVRAYYGIPKSFSAARKALALSGETRPTKKPDADNVLKVVSDALNGITWRDDSQIVTAAVEKFYGETPRIEVTLWAHTGRNLECVK